MTKTLSSLDDLNDALLDRTIRLVDCLTDDDGFSDIILVLEDGVKVTLAASRLLDDTPVIAAVEGKA